MRREHLSSLIGWSAATWLLVVACGEGSGSSGNSGGGYQGPCSKYDDCVSCADASEGCDWCAGECIAAPGYDSEETPGASCEWGFAASSYICTDYGGVRIQPTTLELDCRAIANQENPLCRHPSESTPGSIGGGPAFPLDGRLYGGFADAGANQLVIGAQTNDGVSYGAVLTVDLASGARALVSGAIIDPIQGEITRGSGPALGLNVIDVAPLPDGAWVAWTNENSSTKVLRVDPSSGNRTLMYEDGDTAPCAHAGFNYRFGALYSSSDPFSIAVSPNGTIYLPLGEAEDQSTGDVGVAALSPSGACSVVSLGSTDAGRRLGSGPQADSRYAGVALDGGTLYALSRAGQLHAIDLASGNRTLLSEDGILGEGPAVKTDLVELVDGVLWTTGDGSSSSSGVRVDVDPATGARTPRFSIGGSMASSADLAVFQVAHPTLPGIAIVALENAVTLFDAVSGNNVLLSY